MADIVIARLIFSNDPTNTLVAHQMFVGTLTGSILQLYSVSSILGKNTLFAIGKTLTTE